VGKPLVRFCEGQENNCRYGKDLVAPPRKQAENRENKYFPIASGGSCLLEKDWKADDSGQQTDNRRWEWLVATIIGICQTGSIAVASSP
jgi:hypothetical protein